MTPSIEVQSQADPLRMGVVELSRDIAAKRAAGTSEADITSEVNDEFKRELKDRESMAEDTRETIEDKRRSISAEGDAQNVAKSLQKFFEAHRLGRIIPPGDPQTRAVFDQLVANPPKLNAQKAVYLYPLINGLLNKPNYIQITPGGSASEFEKDLLKMISGHEKDPVEQYIRDLFNSVTIPGIRSADIEERINNSKAKKSKETQKQLKKNERARGGFSDAEHRYITEMLNRDKISEDKLTPYAQEIIGNESKIGLLEALESPVDFRNYYVTKLHEVHAKLLARGINDTEEAKRETTREIHQLFMYLTHRIFAPVIEHAGSQSWHDLISHSSKAFGINPDSIFNHVSQRFTDLLGAVPQFSDYNLEKPFENGKPGFYQLGLEKVRVWETEKKTDDDGNTHIVSQKQRETSVISSDLQPVDSFREFLERFSTSIGAERDLLEVGINFNFLLNTGKTQGDASFFKQAAAYAKDQLKNHRIDELYRLPFGEIVHAARIELASHYKRELALNRWQKKPDIFTSLFQHTNTAEHHVLVEMIKSNLAAKGENPDIPEWAIRRALLHARMHMTLISLDAHAISSYGHPYLTDDLEATYTDATLARLETFRTWWDAEKWRTSELFRYGLAFMPRANRQWKQEVWLPEDVSDEGKKIYQQSEKIGQLALRGRTYFTPETPPNIFELNPMGVGGVEKQSGWGIKYPYTPWIDHFINHPASQENFHMNHKDKPGTEGKKDFRDLEIAWKQLENLGVEVLRNYKDVYLFGLNNDLLDFDKETKKVKYEDHYKKFFGYLYERYFKDGIGRKSFSLKVRNYNEKGMPEEKIDYSSINTAEDFWEKVVEPILNRKTIGGRDGLMNLDEETPRDAEKRNKKARAEDLKEIVNQALGVLIFERMPMDMVYTEDPLISQNGKTLLEELQDHFIRGDGRTEYDAHGHEKHYDGHQMTIEQFQHACHDLEYVQGMARTISIEKIKENLKNQRLAGGSNRPEDLTTFGENKDDFDKLISTITITEGQKSRKQSGYIIDEDIVKDLLTDKYTRIMKSGKDPHITNMEHVNHHVNTAVELYKKVRERIVEKPKESYYELHYDELVDDKWVQRQLNYDKKGEDLYDTEFASKGVKDKRKAMIASKKEEIIAKLGNAFRTARTDGTIKTRLAWSGAHLLDPKVPITINDMAYPLLYFASTGEELVSRRLDQIAGTQEQYKMYIMGEYDSDLKKYYRKEDKAELLKNIIGIRSRIKEWLTDEDYNGTALFILENSINVMRIRSDAENMFAEMDMKILHKKRSAISGVATEGDEYPLRREDRYAMATEFMHSGQFPKRAKEKVFDVVNRSKYRREQLIENLKIIPSGENIANWVANIADMFFSKEEAMVVRKRWQELSGEAMRDRQFANIMDLAKREGPKLIVLIMLALAFLLVVRGYQESEKAA